ncbi:MAG: aminodeoxychorismate synthase component I [Gammaproteobacteria bacterium]|nr:MAG: aminodeoxychorismate synthase component I [Gammaproteobacteria bacterium]
MSRFARTLNTHEAAYHIQPLDDFPDLLAFHRLNATRYPHLLESVSHGTAQSRYDILFAFPGQTLSLDHLFQLTLDDQICAHSDFLAQLDALVSSNTVSPDEHVNNGMDPPFKGGWFVYLSYELIQQIEPSLGHWKTDPSLPVAMASYFPAAIVRDHIQQCSYIVCESGQHQELIAEIQNDIKTIHSKAVDRDIVLAFFEESAPEPYLQAVDKVKRYIRDGDVFQVNLSRLWQACLQENIPSHVLYQRLRHTNPAPFAGLMTLQNDTAVISSSPERLVEVKQGKLSTRPIAGTYPRSSDSQKDEALSQALLAHPKERAEHIMLIDLERNDLGRVCRPGTVCVKELMTVEHYQHVHHIVSEISGELKQGATPGQVIAAVFPGGTITGCPKIRCMEIIQELESTPRGAYTGAMGYISRDGHMDINILIRTLVRHGKDIQLQAGSGLVADSIPERELEETRAKALGMIRAIREA